MMRDDYGFGERILRDLRARRAACEILGVKENADADTLKEAYRRVSLRCHPDLHPDDENATRKFTLVNCAYKLLAEDESCPMLLEEIQSWSGVPKDDKYELDNPWGHFLWWREKFFG